MKGANTVSTSPMALSSDCSCESVKVTVIMFCVDMLKAPIGFELTAGDPGRSGCRWLPSGTEARSHRPGEFGYFIVLASHILRRKRPFVGSWRGCGAVGRLEVIEQRRSADSS